MKILSLQSVLFMTFLWKHNSKEFIKNWFSIDKENQFFYNLSVLRHIVHTRHKEYSDRERSKKVDCN